MRYVEFHFRIRIKYFFFTFATTLACNITGSVSPMVHLRVERLKPNLVIYVLYFVHLPLETEFLCSLL
jgi:hypothetical protein